MSIQIARCSISPHCYSGSVRPITWLLILFQALFLNVFVPGHTRGAITIGVQHEGLSPDVPSCCDIKRPVDAKSHVPTNEDRRCCAVCNVAAMYIPAVPFVTYLHLQQVIRLAHDAAVAQVQSHDYPAPFWPVGPPLVA